MTSRLRQFAIWALVITFLGQSGFAQSTEEQLREMRLEMQKLKGDLDALRAELSRLSGEKQPAPATGADPEELTEAESLPLIRAQVAEQAQTKVETNSKYSMKLFGAIVSNTFMNTGEPNWLDLGNVIMPRPPGVPTGSFSSSLRQSRLGAIIDGPKVGPMRTSGVIAIDFFGGIPNFQTGQVMGLPRLLYGFMRLESKKTAIEIGQDHAILAPKNPTSLTGMAFPILFRAGNLYLRVPQIRVEQVLASGSFGEFRVVGGVLAPVAGDNSTAVYQFVPQNLAGERSRRPAVQARVSWRSKTAGPYEEPKWELGTSGHISKERYTTGISPSWAESIDFDGNIGRFGLGGEFFTGRNIDAFGASLAQNAKSHGGFAEIRLAATKKWDFNGGEAGIQ